MQTLAFFSVKRRIKFKREQDLRGSLRVATRLNKLISQRFSNTFSNMPLVSQKKNFMQNSSHIYSIPQVFLNWNVCSCPGHHDPS